MSKVNYWKDEWSIALPFVGGERGKEYHQKTIRQIGREHYKHANDMLLACCTCLW
jgi:hypothetical protein